MVDGLPASPAQMGYLHALAKLRNAALSVVELTAPEPVLRSRATARRSADFFQRLAAWRERVGRIRNAAVVRHRPYLLVDAVEDVERCAQRVWATCAAPGARPERATASPFGSVHGHGRRGDAHGPGRPRHDRLGR